MEWWHFTKKSGDDKIKILYVIPHFFLSWSTEYSSVYYEIAKNLTDRGHDVTIYTTDVFNKKRDSNSTSYYELNGIKIYEFKSLGRYPFCISSGLIRTFSKTVRNFDVTHIHMYRTLQNVGVWYYLRKHKRPYILQSHGELSANLKKSPARLLFDVFFGRRILKDATCVLALNESEANQCYSWRIPPESVKIIPNGIDFSKFEELPQRGSFRKKLQISDKESIITYLGRIDKTKSIDMLVCSFSQINLEIPNSRLLIIGKDYGSEFKLRKQIKELNLETKVIFTGFLEKREKLAALVDSDVFVTPRFLGFPVTFLEACACGTPIVTTNRGDLLNWIDENVGYVADCGKKSIYCRNLSTSILKILNNESLKKTFRTNCRKIVREQFDWAVVGSIIEKLYLEIQTNGKSHN